MLRWRTDGACEEAINTGAGLLSPHEAKPARVAGCAVSGCASSAVSSPHDPDFVRKWEGLSVFANEDDARALGVARNWKPGVYIATLHIPDNAPLTYQEPEREGSSHWLIYDRHGRMLDESTAGIVLSYVVRLVHGVTDQEWIPRGTQFRVVE